MTRRLKIYTLYKVPGAKSLADAMIGAQASSSILSPETFVLVFIDQRLLIARGESLYMLWLSTDVNAHFS